MMIPHLVPAYGRDYTSRDAVLRDWFDGKDFYFDGRPFNREAAQQAGYPTVNIRYRQLRAVCVVGPTDKAPAPKPLPAPRVESGRPVVEVDADWRAEAMREIPGAAAPGFTLCDIGETPTVGAWIRVATRPGCAPRAQCLGPVDIVRGWLVVTPGFNVDSNGRPSERVEGPWIVTHWRYGWRVLGAPRDVCRRFVRLLGAHEDWDKVTETGLPGGRWDPDLVDARRAALAVASREWCGAPRVGGRP